MATNRRQVLQGSLVSALGFLAGCNGAGPATPKSSLRPLVGFQPLSRQAATGKAIAIAEEYEYQVLVPRGEPLTKGAPEWSWPPSASAQAQQVGIGHDRKELTRHIAHLENENLEWARRAELPVRRDREDLARAALLDCTPN